MVKYYDKITNIILNEECPKKGTNLPISKKIAIEKF